MLPNDNSIYDDRIVQLHDRGIVGRMQQISGDPSADLPPGIDVASPAHPVFDIGQYQTKTRILVRSGTAGVDNYEAFWDSDLELDPIRNARAFEIVGAGFVFDNSLGNIVDWWSAIYLTYDVPNGPLLVPVGSGYSIVNPPAHTHRIAYQGLVRNIYDNPTFNNTGVWVGDLPEPRLSRISFTFDKITGPANGIRVNNVTVAVKLYF